MNRSLVVNFFMYNVQGSVIGLGRSWVVRLLGLHVANRAMLRIRNFFLLRDPTFSNRSNPDPTVYFFISFLKKNLSKHEHFFCQNLISCKAARNGEKSRNMVSTYFIITVPGCVHLKIKGFLTFYRVRRCMVLSPFMLCVDFSDCVT